jgi:hypothetical protein
MSLIERLNQLADEQAEAEAVMLATDVPRSATDIDRQLTQDLADFDEDPEVRKAANDALASNDPAVITMFLNKGLPVLRAAAVARQKEIAAENRATVQKWTTTGGPIARKRATEVLATNDDDRIADFIAVGKATADEMDAKAVKDAEAEAKRIQARVEQMVALGGYEVKLVGQLALDSEDPEVIADFYNNGFKVASKSDADGQREIQEALTARTKAVSDLVDLAQRSTQAATARQQIIEASVTATKELTLTASTMALANNYAKQGDAIYAQDLPIRKAGGKTHTADLTKLLADARAASTQTARHAGLVSANAGVANVAAQTLVKTGLSHGVDWAEVLDAQKSAGEAAKLAAETAVYAAEATEAASKALDADRNATVQANNAVKYRKSAEAHQAAAEKQAALAAKLAESAQAAERDAKKQRERAEKDAREAWQHASNAETHYKNAVVQRNIARQAMLTAVKQEAVARQAALNAIKHNDDVKAKGAVEKKLLDDFMAAGKHFSKVTKDADAATRRAAKALETTNGKEFHAATLAAKAAKAEGTADWLKAVQAADAARVEADGARVLSDKAQAEAKTAAGASKLAADAAATAERAAANAHAEANAARNEANAAHRNALDAADAANRAIKDAQKANADAQAAVTAARSAITHATAAKSDAELTQKAAEASWQEAGIASFQSRIAGRSAINARLTSMAIADPAAKAVDLAAEYSETDNDAAMAVDIATTAMVFGEQQSTSAGKHAEDADAAVRHAVEQAAKADAQVLPAFTAAKKAADAAAAAVKSSKVAIDAAIGAGKHAEATIEAADSAAEADGTASRYAEGAERMAAEASQDAAVARQSSNNAQRFAASAKQAAVNANKIANLMDGAATSAKKLADAMLKTAAKIATNADHLLEMLPQVLDAERQIYQGAWLKWMHDKIDWALGDIPFVSPALEAAAVSFVDMVGGIWYMGNCFFGGSPAGGDKKDYVPPYKDPSWVPDSNVACGMLHDGVMDIVNNPLSLLHWDELKEGKYAEALGMFAVDVGLFKLSTFGKVAKGIDILKAGLPKTLAGVLSKDLAAGIAKFGAEAMDKALAKLGSINLSKILELGDELGSKLKLKFDDVELSALKKALVIRGFDKVEKMLRDLGDLPVIDGIKKLLKEADPAERLRGCLLNSFSGETLVVMAVGPPKPIRKVLRGDRVLATDPKARTTSVEVVTEVHQNRDTALADVQVAGANFGPSVIHTTQDHQFWNHSSRAWTRAADLKPATNLLTPVGDTVKVVSVAAFVGSRTMYNLTISSKHTYYVMAGASPVLVHNDDGCKLALGPDNAGKMKAWAENNDFDHFMDDKLWRGPVRLMIEGGKVELHVNLDGMGVPGVSPNTKFLRALEDGMGENPYATSEEMTWIGRSVYHNLRSWDSVKFYDEGGLLPKGAIPEPDWEKVLGTKFLNDPNFLIRVKIKDIDDF